MVEGRGSRVTSRGSRINGRGSRVTSRGSKNSSQLLLNVARQIKISCLLKFPVSVLFYFNTKWYNVFFNLFGALVGWNKLTFVILPGYTVVDTDGLYYEYSMRRLFCRNTQ